MTKEEKKTKQLIDKLSKMPSMMVETAYIHAINYALYGEDVTEKWVTATQQTAILEKAYNKGYYDALQRYVESEGITSDDIFDKIKAQILGEAEYAYADFDRYKEDILHAEPDELPDDDFRYGMERAYEIINEHIKEVRE